MKLLATNLETKPNTLPLCQLLKDNLDKFFVSANTGIDMNVTADIYSYILNPNRLVKVGNDILQFNYENVKTITNGDITKIANLVNVQSTINGVIVSNVERTSKLISKFESSGRTENSNWGSCDSGNMGGYRVLGYVEEVRYGSFGFFGSHIYIKLRSLEKSWVWWVNYEATDLYSAGYVRIYKGSPAENQYWVDGYYTTPPYSGSMHTRTWTFFNSFYDTQSTAIYSKENSFHTPSGAYGCNCFINP